MGKLSKSEVLYWNDILAKFESYTGSVKDFCEEHGIDKRKLYYRRSKAQKSKQQLFHAVNLNTSSTPSAPHKYTKDYKEIKIKLGKATIFIPSDDIMLLLNIIRELELSCVI
ncbi:MAG: hypothetical protein RSB70_01755 [Clostridium sp.]